MAWSPQTLTVATRLAGRPVVADTELVPMRDLAVGDRFLGLDPAQPVLVVAAAPDYLPDGWLAVDDASMGPADRELAERRGDAEPGCLPGAGAFSACVVAETVVKRIVRLADRARDEVR